MTDKTERDALRARELLAAEYTKRGMGVDFVNDAGTPTAIALAAIREALAAPAEALDDPHTWPDWVHDVAHNEYLLGMKHAASVDVEGFRPMVVFAKEYASTLDPDAAQTINADADRLLALIDSAGGAKGYEETYATPERLAKPTATENCDFCGARPGELHAYDCTALDETPQPAEGDGAVDMRTVGDHNGRLLDLDYAATCLDGCGYQFTAAEKVRRVRNWLAKLYPRPAATAVVPDLIAEWEMLIEHPDTSTIMRTTLRHVVERLKAAAPAAPKGGVDEADRLAALNAAAMIDVLQPYDAAGKDAASIRRLAALANQEQRHDALADGDSASA